MNIPWKLIIEERQRRESARFEKEQLPAYAPSPEPPTLHQENTETGTVVVDDRVYDGI